MFLKGFFLKVLKESLKWVERRFRGRFKGRV